MTGTTVLIVDDNPANLAVVVQCLEAHGLGVLVAQDGEEAVQRAELIHPDLILMDVMMPEMDGLAACRRLKAGAATRDIPVIFMTALNDTASKIAGFTAGGVDFVTKPFEAAEVLARVDTHLNLAAMRAALAAQNRALEDRVSQRTAELEAANRELRIEVDARKRIEARLRRLVDSNIIGVLFWDLADGITEANDAFLDLVGYDRRDLLAGRLHWGEMTPPEYREADARAVEEIRATGSCLPFDKEFVRNDGSRVPVLFGGALLNGSRDEGVAFVLDLTERRQADERQKMLLGELNHRVKNTLAIVQAIAVQTMRTAQSTEQFWAAFEGRLLALSQTHDALCRGNWEGASLRDVLEGELAPHADDDVPSFVLTGRDIRLGPVAAVTMGMAIHELATNAAKYGALSVPTGQVRVSWEVDDRHHLHLDWLEVGGPPIEGLHRPGFGSRLIETALARELAGEVHLEFRHEGVHCTMETSIERVCPH